MKRLLAAVSVLLACCTLLSGCINKNEKASDDLDKIELDTIYRKANEALKIIQPQLKENMSEKELIHVIFQVVFPNMHELHEQEINEMFDKLPENIKEDYYRRTNKTSTSIKTIDKFTVLDFQIEEKYEDNYYYINDSGISELRISQLEGIPFSKIECFLQKYGSGLLVVSNYLTQENAKIVKEKRADSFPKTGNSKFSFSFTKPQYDAKAPNVYEKVRPWKVLELILEKIDLSVVK